jgi:uncharacterized protein YihD (DUF1040 family)
MREFERIDRILALIQEVWIKHPDLRLTQLVYIVLHGLGDDNFYVEDTVLENRLKEFLEHS